MSTSGDNFAWQCGLRDRVRQVVRESIAAEIEVAGILMKKAALAEVEALVRETEPRGEQATADAIRRVAARLGGAPRGLQEGAPTAPVRTPQSGQQPHPAIPKRKRRRRRTKARSAQPAPGKSGVGPEFDDRPF